MHANMHVDKSIDHQTAVVHKLHDLKLQSENVIRFYNEMYEMTNDLFSQIGLGLYCQTE